MEEETSFDKNQEAERASMAGDDWYDDDDDDASTINSNDDVSSRRDSLRDSLTGLLKGETKENKRSQERAKENYTEETQQNFKRNKKIFEKKFNAIFGKKIEEITKVEDKGLVDLASNNIKEEFDQKINETYDEINEENWPPPPPPIERIIESLPPNPTQEEIDEWVEEWVGKVKDEFDRMSFRKKLKLFFGLLLDKARLIFRMEIPKTEEGKKIVEEEVQDLKRLGRLKEFVKNNKIALGSVIISVGSIITAIVMSTRKSVKNSSHYAKSAASELKKYLKNFDPVIQNGFGLVANALVLGAKGLEFLAENLALASILITIYINF